MPAWRVLVTPFSMAFVHTKAGGYLKTHDFLQPLEQAEKTLRREETKVEVATVEKPPPPVAATPSGEHLLPGGIGTFSISYLHQRVPKPEASLFSVAQASSTDRNDENSNCSSYTGSGFTLWDESAVNKGKTGKENSGGDRHILRGKFLLPGFMFNLAHSLTNNK